MLYLPTAFGASLIFEISRWKPVFLLQARKKSFWKPVAAFSLVRSWFWSWLFRRGGFRLRPSPPTLRTAFEDMAMVQQAVKHGGDRGTIAEKFYPVFHRAIGA